MKIGILTYHRSHNYGALLQAIALRYVLEQMGHQATFIDYWPAYHRHMYMVFSWHAMMQKRSKKSKFRYLQNCIMNWAARIERIERFAAFIRKYIEPHLSSMDENYDVVVHGSDQIWRKQPEMREYNPVYFGDNGIQTNKNISYAASMGVLPQTDDDFSKLKSLISHLNSISVRESGLKDVVHKLGFESTLCLDPTLLLSVEQWKKIIPFVPSHGGGYVLYYYLQDNVFDKSEIIKFTKANKLRLITIYSKAIKRNTSDEITTADPEQFLSLIAGAKFIFTSSFHGLAFSLLFHKPFYASFKKNAGRASSLLSALGLDYRLLSPCSSIPNEDTTIDYNHVDSQLASMRQESLQYLQEL